MGWTAAAGALALACAPTGWGLQSSPIGESWSRRAGDYLRLAQPYRAGEIATAIAAMRAVATVDADEAQQEIARHPQLVSTRQIDEKDLEALVALHTETALILAQGRDGVGAEDQLRLAARLLDWITNHRVTQPVFRHEITIDRVAWLRTAPALAVEVWIPELALDLIDEGLKTAPDDARMNLVAAIVEEALFLAGSRRGAKQGVDSRFPGVRTRVSPAEHRRAARSIFRKVVELDPALVEARDGARALSRRAAR